MKKVVLIIIWLSIVFLFHLYMTKRWEENRAADLAEGTEISNDLYNRLNLKNNEDPFKELKNRLESLKKEDKKYQMQDIESQFFPKCTEKSVSITNRLYSFYSNEVANTMGQQHEFTISYDIHGNFTDVEYMPINFYSFPDISDIIDKLFFGGITFIGIIIILKLK